MPATGEASDEKDFLEAPAPPFEGGRMLLRIVAQIAKPNKS
jgi:hypothetical protein